ncbi:myosin-4 [Lepeophtheirus salmonis]|uniref:myosin-4 n=1 Tax=Lepeophtheirus salmonis TaxID=72036 RepID=UPI001AEB9A96|nr:myosin heavy chain, muscle-like [Lepeophtheirus salmonis]
MPGHDKKGKPGEPDPDPEPYLVISMEMKREDMLKPYDPKKSVWAPDGNGGFKEGLLVSDEDGKALVMIGHEKKTFKSEAVGQINPPKFEKCEDMANLTYLNDGSVFHNLEARFKAKLIYTYSGLFCIVVNPYKRYPIYTPRVVKMYLGKRRNEVPPHLWAITETAYRNMLQNSKDQSMLITGESGAGKTENTKKVISYLAMVASSGKKSQKKVSLEDQIVATNPILESYGNAKTSRNDNSSRFGKFIRIHFTPNGKLAGCDIESYLLEKSRITQQQSVERSYHIFYQLLQPFVADMKSKCCLSDDIYDYQYVSQGKVSVPSIDDNEELEFTDQAFDIIGFTENEKWDCYKITAAVMSFGEVKFKQKGRDDQAEPDDLTYPNKVGELLGVNPDELMKSFCKPKIKVGTEWVTKGQTCEQATNGVGGIARGCFDRLFKWLIIKCNDTLIDPTMKKSHFVAVLDIAGFEIFEYNGFEQISINFVNEKLQQFFNHHMFVVEQEEYVSEGIDWAMVDFGMDLAAAIIMFEKPMGIWAILEEESLFPKATDKSFEEKLKAQHLGKSAPFAKPQSKTDKNAHFAIIHYAGIVSYNVTAWLEKNKDPVNDTVVDVLKRASNELLVFLWREHPGQSNPPDDKGKKKKKGGGGKTVSSVYLVQLTDLMNTLHCTEPHFIRCIVPNTHKKPLEVEPPLIMHQLTCNGVLEGIRICMRGFPNRMLYPDYKSRYQILGAQEIATAKDNKTGVYALMDKISFPREKYRLGHTKVFFRAGALAQLEEDRDLIVLKLVRWIQGQFHGFIRRKDYKKRFDQRELLKVIQRNFKKYMSLRNWGWFIIIQKTRPLIGQLNMEEELKKLEEQANEAYGAYTEALSVTKELEESNSTIKADINGLSKQLESEQGNLSQYQDRQIKANTLKAEIETELVKKQDLLAQEEVARQEMEVNRKKMMGDAQVLKKDIEDIEIVIQKVEQEKSNRDHTIRSLNEEVAESDELINKINKEKKHIGDNQSKAVEDLQGTEDKVNHLTSIKSKLETTLDELEDSVEREKRQKCEVEKIKRKLESELRMTQESVNDLDQQKKELEGTILRKESEASKLASKLEDEQSLVSKTQKQIKELQGRVEEYEEELEAERQARAKAERQRSDLAREIDELGERYDEAGSATHAQTELNKKRESEIHKLRRDVEEANIQQESLLSNLKKKHQDAIQEMMEQIEQLSKMKSKIEKDKVKIQHEIADARAATDEIIRARSSSEKSNKNLTGQLNELNKKLEEANLTLGDFESAKRKLAAENSDLLRVVGDIGNNVNMLQKMKASLQSNLEEAKHIADHESHERFILVGKFKNLEHELDGMREQLEEEVCARNDLTRQISKCEGEVNLWRSKYETEAVAKSQELEMSKMKLTSRLTEAESTIENLNSKLQQIDKSRQKLQEEYDEMSYNFEQAQILHNQMEKKARQFDKIVNEWKLKVDGLSMDLDVSQKDCRNTSSELFRIKSAYDEYIQQLDEVRRENKHLSNEIKDIMDQISEGGRSIHEIDKIRKRLEAEKLELQAALEEAEGALEQEENKVLRSQLELTQVRQEIERRIQEKDEEFEGIKKNQGKAVEGMQMALENESKGKAEALRMKKKLESDVTELEMSLEHANANNIETQKSIKKYQQQIRESQAKLEEEQRAKDMARDEQVISERRSHTLQNSLEEARTLLEQADRNRRTLEQELSDSNEVLSEYTVQNQAIVAAKRKLENELQNLQADLDEMNAEAHLSDEKASKAMIDAARLADELRNEQEHASKLERDRKLIESQSKDIHMKLDEAENASLKNGKKAMNKMETRIRELESELDAESRRMADAQKNLRKSERRIKELTFASDEDRKNHERMQSLVDQLQSRIKSYKKQIEEAEEIAALNLAKFRQTQSLLSSAEGRADLSEQALAKTRARARSASIGPNY